MDTKKMPLFQVVFNDGTVYHGGFSNQKTLWADIPNKPIKRIFFLLPNGDHLCLAGYEKYNRFIEATKDWMRFGKGKFTKLENEPRIEYVYIMGLKNGIVTSYRIVMFDGKKGKDKYKKGDITMRQCKLGTEWHNKPTSGWK